MSYSFLFVESLSKYNADEKKSRFQLCYKIVAKDLVLAKKKNPDKCVTVSMKEVGQNNQLGMEGEVRQESVKDCFERQFSFPLMLW